MIIAIIYNAKVWSAVAGIGGEVGGVIEGMVKGVVGRLLVLGVLNLCRSLLF